MSWNRVWTTHKANSFNQLVIDRMELVIAVPMSASVLRLPRKKWRVSVVRDGIIIEVLGVFRSREDADAVVGSRL